MIGYVYKLHNPSDPDNFYVGSTLDSLNTRLVDHKTKAKNGGKKGNSILYRTMRENGIRNWTIELLKECEVPGPNSLATIEQSFINELKPTLNTKRAKATPEDHQRRIKL
jgi:hypothetical protein